MMMGCTCLAANTPPAILKEPILGLRYEVTKTKFEPMPSNEASKCQSNENLTSVWFVYGKYTDNSSRTYYVTGGYDIWKNPEPNQQKYEADEYGGIFYISGDECIYIDEARQTFIDRVFNEEMSPHVLQALASDAAARLVRAYGGADRLRREVRHQKVDIKALPTELRKALTPYFATGTQPHQ